MLNNNRGYNYSNKINNDISPKNQKSTMILVLRTKNLPLLQHFFNWKEEISSEHG